MPSQSGITHIRVQNFPSLPNKRLQPVRPQKISTFQLAASAAGVGLASPRRQRRWSRSRLAFGAGASAAVQTLGPGWGAPAAILGGAVVGGIAGRLMAGNAHDGSVVGGLLFAGAAAGGVAGTVGYATALAGNALGLSPIASGAAAGFATWLAINN